MRARGEASSAHVRVLHPLPEPAVLELRRAMGKKPKGPMTVDALGNAVSVAELEERKAAEEARAAAKARREAKAAAGADAGAAGDAADPSGVSGVSAGGDIVSLEDQLKALVLKVRDGQKLTGKEKRAFAKAEKEGRLPRVDADADTENADAGTKSTKKAHPALSMPESWARALEAVTVHARGGTNDDGGADDGKTKTASDAVVDVAGLDVSIRGATLLEEADLRVPRGAKVALLGANGSGKSTLVRLVASGRIKAATRDVACVAQELDASDSSAFESLCACDAVAARLQREESEIIRRMDDASPSCDTNENTNEDTNEDTNENTTTSIRKNEDTAKTPMSESEWRSAAARLGEIGDELEQRGAYAAEADARRILTGLGFDETKQNKPLSQLSGGWRMRAALAVALFLRPGLLLLDEPTNHLDLPATIWLASYLNSRECADTAVLLVTHSADFVAETATHLVHLDHFKKKLVVQKHADVWRFLAAAPERFKQEKARYEAQRARLKNLKTKSGLSGDAATRRVLKEEGKSAAIKKKANGANGANVEPLADADGLLLKPREYQVSFTFPASEDDRPTIAVLDACFAIPDSRDPGANKDASAKKLVDFKNLRFSVHARSKIVLVGPNGCGKSTLLKLLMGDVLPDAGEVHAHRDLRIGRHDQHHEASFDFGDDGGPSESRASAAALLEKTFGVANQDARRLLGQSGLESSAHVVPFAKLSGGQKSRVAFAALCAKPQNLLLLDEPTNHLDLESVEALIDGLNKFEGGVVVSTHDARLAEGLDDAEIWLVGAEGSTTGVDVLGRAGDAKPFARYRARVAAEVEAATEETKRRAAQRRRGAKERGARFS